VFSIQTKNTFTIIIIIIVKTKKDCTIVIIYKSKINTKFDSRNNLGRIK